MPEQWLSVAQAAASMKVHTRTIERRLAAGKIESRRNDDGQILVLVNVSDPVEPVPSEAFETVKELANQQVDLAAGSASALVRVAQDQAMRAENQLLLARQDARRYRKEMQLAVALVACILIMVIVAVGWVTRTITASQADARRASDSAVRAADDAHLAQQTLESQRDKLDTARIDRARAEGELAAYKTQLSGMIEKDQKKPATQPTTLIDRMTQAFVGN